MNNEFGKILRDQDINPEDLTEEEIKTAINGFFKVVECGHCGSKFKAGGLVDNDNNYLDCPECGETSCLPL